MFLFTRLIVFCFIFLGNVWGTDNSLSENSYSDDGQSSLKGRRFNEIRNNEMERPSSQLISASSPNLFIRQPGISDQPKITYSSTLESANLTPQITPQNSGIIPPMIQSTAEENSPVIRGGLPGENEIFSVQNNENVNIEALLRSLGIAEAPELTEAINFFIHRHLSVTQVHEARMEALFMDQSNKVKGIHDWVTRGWRIAKWLVGTSQNFSTVAVVVLAVLANCFPDRAVLLATVSGAVGAFGTLLSKMYDYCQEKSLNRLAYNLVVMAVQATKIEQMRTLEENLTTINGLINLQEKNA